MRLRFKSTDVAALALAGLVIGLWLVCFSTAARPVRPSGDFSSAFAPLQSAPLFSDFDGDHQLDQAELVSGGMHKSIHLTLSSSWTQHLSFDSKTSERGVLIAKDIDRDNDLDLIWVSPLQRSSAVVWLGDGRGNFELASNPEAYAPAINLLLDREQGAAISDPQWPADPACGLPFSASVDLEPGNKLRVGLSRTPLTASHTRCTGLTPYLSYLRQRGPPADLS